MSDSEKLLDQPMRKIRPWIAALLTFLGWGVGLYYARRTKLAVRMAVANVLIAVLGFAILIAYIFNKGPAQPTKLGIDDSALADFASLTLTVIVALGVWTYISRQPTEVERGDRSRLWGYLGIWALPIICSVLLAFAIRVAILQPFHIPAGSMQPTLMRGDYMAVTKWSYGYSRYSFSPFHFVLPEGRIFGDTPNRGDIVVFSNPKDRDLSYVKRVVGLPGDEIHMVDGLIYINGVPVQKKKINHDGGDCGGYAGPQYEEVLPDGVSYIVQECSGDNGRLDNVGPYNVPDGHYFMMGDNRDQSQDSRITSQVGYIPYERLLGKVRIQER